MSAALEAATDLLKAVDAAKLLDVLHLADVLRDRLSEERAHLRDAERARRRITLWDVHTDQIRCNAGKGCEATARMRAVYAGGGRISASRYACEVHTERLRQRGAVDGMAEGDR